MAKSAKTNDKMTSNNKKKPVLFEELVRTIYNELHYIKNEPEEIEDIHEPSCPKDVLLFSYEILLYLCNCRTNQSAFDYSEEINEILTYIAGYNLFDSSSNLPLLFNLECYFRFQDKESAIFRWQLLYFLEYYYNHDCPEHDCLVAIRNELEAQKQVQAIMDTSEKNHEIYFNLLLKYKDQKAYQELIENNFAEKHDALYSCR